LFANKINKQKKKKLKKLKKLKNSLSLSLSEEKKEGQGLQYTNKYYTKSKLIQP
jgi:hypothetical protein